MELSKRPATPGENRITGIRQRFEQQKNSWGRKAEWEQLWWVQDLSYLLDVITNIEKTCNSIVMASEVDPNNQKGIKDERPNLPSTPNSLDSGPNSAPAENPDYGDRSE